MDKKNSNSRITSKQTQKTPSEASNKSTAQQKMTQRNLSGDSSKNKFMAASVNSQMLIQLMDNKEMGHEDIYTALKSNEPSKMTGHNRPLGNRDINIINNFNE